jgi:hypothetical protein
MHIFNIHTNIQQIKRVFTKKLWEGLTGQIYHLFSNKGAKLQQEKSEWFEIFPSWEILTNKLHIHSKFQLDSKTLQTDGQNFKDGDRYTDITVRAYTINGSVQRLYYILASVLYIVGYNFNMWRGRESGGGAPPPPPPPQQKKL